MSLDLDIYYRGPLASCNYACDYCPFAKREDDRAAFAEDAAALERFVAWIRERPESDRIGVLFTPWGEALIHRHYRAAISTLSHCAVVRRVAIQTNLSGPLAWIDRTDRSRFALWCTYHPSQTTRAKFLSRCATLDAMGVRYSVGMVGLRGDLDEIEAMRQALPAHIYLWVNAYKRVPMGYSSAERARLQRVDPLFSLNLPRHPSRGLPCRAGATSISVDGDGTVRRCHFVAEPIGNLFDPESFPSCLRPRTCPNTSCGCYIGYTNLIPLGLERIYGARLLERIPLTLDPSLADRAAGAMKDLDAAASTVHPPPPCASNSSGPSSSVPMTARPTASTPTG